MIKMSISDIKNEAQLDTVKYPDAADRKRMGLDQYYINFTLEDGGFGSFDENQSNDDEVEVNY